ncbi:uncharacterized protein B0I36DRAFT_327931 [Microdochium trichocladiopsis]|uniref:Uncharacterized protein n=1 Tax=Microdochium trichocladiopsis TaxID=1682393 RepID=A0A9P8Y4H9_9PEZI|nr:uncharacterized protein B0I36DRAFT_327931 [Microdochium trichocladiopsis]KAH7027792.1 hypothetical protein B0I36DRAFT_327931 [Microdochium trichocladiopsis]
MIYVFVGFRVGTMPTCGQSFLKHLLSPFASVSRAASDFERKKHTRKHEDTMTNRQFRDKAKLVTFAILAFPFIAAYTAVIFAGKGVARTIGAGEPAKLRADIATRRIPKSRPLLGGKEESHDRHVSQGIHHGGHNTTGQYGKSGTGSTTTFLDLPLEIRRKIYALALGQAQFVQPGLGLSCWGYAPPDWPRHKRICTDSDPGSNALRVIIGLGGSAIEQFPRPRKQGCVRYGRFFKLFAPDGVEVRFHTHPSRPSWLGNVDLMRTCRAVYADMLDILYGDVTVCLFGEEMVHYFLRNASPEGLSAVRFVQVALFVSEGDWETRSSRRAVERALRGLGGKLPGLEQLHVEVVMMFGQPAGGTRKFWDWLVGAFKKSGLQGRLRRFVLKISIYLPEKRIDPDIMPLLTEHWGYDVHFANYMHVVMPLAGLGKAEYLAFKDAMTGNLV